MVRGDDEADGSQERSRTYRRRLMAFAVSLVLVAAVVVVAGVVALRADSDGPVLDADGNEVESETALFAVEAWRARGEAAGEVRVLWEGESTPGGTEPARTVVLQADGRLVSAVRSGRDGRWSIRDGQEVRFGGGRLSAVGAGYLFRDAPSSESMEVWCPRRSEGRDSRPAGGGFVSTLPVVDGFVDPGTPRCVGRVRLDSEELTVWMEEPDRAPVVATHDEAFWEDVTSSDGSVVVAAVQAAISRIQGRVPEGLRMPDEAAIELMGVVDVPRDLGFPARRAGAVQVRTLLEPPIGVPAEVVAVGLVASLGDGATAQVIGVSDRSRSGGDAVAASWIGADQENEGRPFLLYASSPGIEALELRLGRRDLQPSGPVGFVALPDEAGDRTSLPFSLVGTDDDGFPVPALEPPAR